MSLYACRNCGILATERSDRCPACKSRHGANGQGGTAFRRVDAERLLDELQ
jgi:hypothetical protein